MQQSPTNSVVEDSDNLIFYTQEAGGYLFFHLDVKVSWTKSLKQHVLKLFTLALVKAKTDKHTLVFMTTDNEKSIKFWKTLAPLEDLTKFGSRNQYWLGAWHIEETLEWVS